MHARRTETAPRLVVGVWRNMMGRKTLLGCRSMVVRAAPAFVIAEQTCDCLSIGVVLGSHDWVSAANCLRRWTLAMA